jgi:hypothetical protein
MPVAVIQYTADPTVPNLLAAVSVSLSAGEIQLSYQGLLAGQLTSDSRSFRGSSPIVNTQKAACAGSLVLPIPSLVTSAQKGGFAALAVSFINTSSGASQATLNIDICQSDGTFSAQPFSQTVAVAAQSTEHFHISFQA